jgi:hypothetical protein
MRFTAVRMYLFLISRCTPRRTEGRHTTVRISDTSAKTSVVGHFASVVCGRVSFGVCVSIWLQRYKECGVIILHFSMQACIWREALATLLSHSATLRGEVIKT